MDKSLIKTLYSYFNQYPVTANEVTLGVTCLKMLRMQICLNLQTVIKLSLIKYTDKEN